MWPIRSLLFLFLFFYCFHEAQSSLFPKNKVEHRQEDGLFGLISDNGYDKHPVNIIQRFLGRLETSVSTKTESLIEQHFAPNYHHHTCTRNYTKEPIIKKFLNLASESATPLLFELRFETVKDVGSSLKFIVKITGFGSRPWSSQFVLNKKDQLLESGNQCDSVFSPPYD